MSFEIDDVDKTEKALTELRAKIKDYAIHMADEVISTIDAMENEDVAFGDYWPCMRISFACGTKKVDMVFGFEESEETD